MKSVAILCLLIPTATTSRTQALRSAVSHLKVGMTRAEVQKALEPLGVEFREGFATKDVGTAYMVKLEAGDDHALKLSFASKGGPAVRLKLAELRFRGEAVARVSD